MTTESIFETINSILPEISISQTGVVSFTRKSVSRLLGISHTNLMGDRQAKKLSEKLTALGFDRVRAGDNLPDTMVAAIIEYYAFDAQNISPVAVQLYRAFASVGIRQFIQDLKGWELPEPPKNKLAKMKEAYEAFGQMIAIYEYADNKPGLENMVSHALSEPSDLPELPGLLTVEDILNRKGLQYTAEQKAAIGMYAATAYRNLTGQKPQQIKKIKRDEITGKVSGYMVSGYPIDFLPIVENAIDLGFGS